jgi:DNA-binding response OmpR family regulator
MPCPIHDLSGNDATVRAIDKKHTDGLAFGRAIDGITLAFEIAPRGVPVIFLTGDYERACVEGREFAADILIKPISVPAFLNSVSSVLRTKVE